ncbi:putative serine proteinase inhibitor [Bacteroidales bacterium KA00251]|nr:putative serine proteinase inhibitor [Bacteroidales bacterium KA00251]
MDLRNRNQLSKMKIMTKRSFYLVAILAFMPLLFFSCSKKPNEPKVDQAKYLAGGKLPAEGASLPKITNKEHLSLNPEDLPLVSAGNEFNLKLFAQLLQKSGDANNLVISPLSLETALGMNVLGVSDEAFEEYRNVLGYPHIRSAQDLASYLKRLTAVITSSGERTCFFPANSFWLSSKYEQFLLKNYPSLLYDYFDASSATLDLSKPESYEVINNWVNRKTYGRIANMLDPKKAKENDAYALLVNAAFFAASWDWNAEKESTKKEIFRNGLGHSENAMMMQIHSQVSTSYAANDRFECLSVGLVSGETKQLSDEAPFRMLLMLPKEKNASLSKELPTEKEILALATDAKVGTMNIKLPRLDAKLPTLDITKDLISLGLVKSLGRPLTHLSRMFDQSFLADPTGKYNNKNRGNNVLHQASIKWDEKSVEAAAATVIEVGVNEPGIDKPSVRNVVFDRPFFAVILHPKSNKILFIAAINTLK